MTTDLVAVDPDFGGVGGGTEAEHDLLASPSRRHDDAPQVPSDTEVVARVLELLVPAGRHGDAARRRKILKPALLLADLLRIDLERPEAREIADGAVRVLLRIERHACVALVRESDSSNLLKCHSRESGNPGQLLRSLPWTPAF